MTGFSFTSDTVDELDVSSILKADITNTDDTTYQLHDTTIYKTTSTDTQVGLFIRYGDAANGSLKKVQLSFVFIGVRSYTESSYPSQSPVELDDFIFFAGVNYAINGDGVTSFFPFARPTSPTPLPPTYDDTKFLGNAFCGFNNIKLQAN